jgi:hypothetical protein
VTRYCGEQGNRKVGILRSGTVENRQTEKWAYYVLGLSRTRKQKSGHTTFWDCGEQGNRKVGILRSGTVENKETEKWAYYVLGLWRTGKQKSEHTTFWDCGEQANRRLGIRDCGEEANKKVGILCSGTVENKQTEKWAHYVLGLWRTGKLKSRHTAFWDVTPYKVAEVY